VVVLFPSSSRKTLPIERSARHGLCLSLWLESMKNEVVVEEPEKTHSIYVKNNLRIGETSLKYY